MADYDLGTARGRIEIDASTLGRTSAAFDTFGKSLLGIGAVALAGFGVAVKASADFERVMSGVEAVLAPTTAEMEALRKKTLQLGQDTIFSAKDVAEGMESMAKAGLSAEEMIGGAADAAVNLAAAAGNMNLDRAAEIAANAMRQFNIPASDMVQVADALAGAANASTVEVEDLAVSMKYAGSVASAMGVSFDETNAALAILGDRGIKGSTAGTSLRGVLLSLTGSSGPATAALKELGIITEEGGNKFFDAQGNMKSLAEVSQILQDATRGLSEEQKTSAFNTIFQRRAMSSALILAEQGADGFARYTAEIQKVSAADVAAKKLDNLSGDVEILRGNLETLLIEQGSVFQDMLRGWVQGLTQAVQWFTNLDKGTQKLIMQFLLWGGIISATLGGFMLFVGAMVKMYRTTKDLIRGVKLIVGAMKLLTTTMMANPVLLVVAAIVALGVALFAAYKKFEGFRKFVDEAWQTLQRFWDTITDGAVAAWHGFQDFWDQVTSIFSTGIAWIKQNWDILLAILIGPIGAVIVVWRRFGDDIRNIVMAVVEAVVGFFQQLPGRIVGFFDSIWDTVFGFFTELPGQIVAGGATAIEAFVDFLAQLPERAGYFLGFVLGKFLQFFIDGVAAIVQFGVDFTKAAADFLTALPGKVWNWLTETATKIATFITDSVTAAVTWGADFTTKTGEWLMSLPGKVWNWLVSVTTTIARFIADSVTKAADWGVSFVGAIAQWMTALPGKVWEWLQETYRKIVAFVIDTIAKANEVGGKIFSGIVDQVEKLPGKVGELLGRVIDAFKNLVRRGYNAVKDFASGLWNGFVDGLFGSPYTKIEYAVWNMVDNVDKSLGTFRQQVREIQSLGNGLNSLNDINPQMNLGLAQGAGVVNRPASALTPYPGASASPQASTSSGDTIQIFGADQKSALEIVREYSFQKRVTVSS